MKGVSMGMITVVRVVLSLEMNMEMKMMIMMIIARTEIGEVVGVSLVEEEVEAEEVEL